VTPGMQNLVACIEELADALHVHRDDAWKQALRAKLAEDELDQYQPQWLVPFISSLAAGNPTPEWVPFHVVGLESSGAFDFVRTLDRLLPVTVRDDGERYTVIAYPIGFEAILAFEGYLWLVKPIGATEPGE